jgi:hypothetical protein
MWDEIVAHLANTLNAPIAAEARHAEQAPTPDSMDLYFKVWLGRLREWDGRIDPPSQKIVARPEFDVFVAELGDLARKLLKRKMPTHVGVKCDLGIRPCYRPRPPATAQMNDPVRRGNSAQPAGRRVRSCG